MSALMSTLYKKYIPTDKDNVKIKFTISFNKETINWATNEPMKRGYRVHATPVEITKHESGIQTESFEAFSGFGDTILEVERQSKKRLETAKELLNNKMPVYVNWFKEKGFTIIE